MTSRRSDQPARDRRVQRTQAAILGAFNQLMLEEGYDAITSGRLAMLANVGRSTFYEHFSGVDEVLAFSIGRLITPLAKACTKARLDPVVIRIVQHFWDNRKAARAMFAGGGHVGVARLFAEQFEAALHSRAATPAQQAAVKLAATYLTAGLMAVLGAWLSGQIGGGAEQIARALHAASRAGAKALTVEA